MKSIIILCTVFIWTCSATQYCLDLGFDYGYQTLQAGSDPEFQRWFTMRGAELGACDPDDVEVILTGKERKTRPFCKQFKPTGRHAYRTLQVPTAAKEWFEDHNAVAGECYQRNRGKEVKMTYVEPEEPPEPETFIMLEFRTDNYGEDTSWTVHDTDGNEVAASAGKKYRSNKKLKEKVPLDCGDYVVTINDSGGDGMTKGGYAIFDEGNHELLRSTPGPFNEQSHVIRLCYNPEDEMSSWDIAWLKAHNRKRKAFHQRYGRSYVPLQWSKDLASMAWEAVDHALDDCGKEELHAHHESGYDDFGENILGEQGVTHRRGSNPFDMPDEVLMHWTEQQANRKYPANNARTQVMWRASHYVGCASGVRRIEGKNTYCERHACMYAAPGNCNMAKYKSTIGNNYLTPVLKKYSNCGAQCPHDGCYYHSFDAL